MSVVDILWFIVAAYLVAQIVSLVFSEGQTRLAMAMPLLLMVPVLAVTAVSLLQNSHLWPIWLFLASPWALAYLALIAAYQMWPVAVPKQLSKGNSRFR